MSAQPAVRNTEQVPRRTGRSPGPDSPDFDESAARRVAHERESRGWTQTELARRVTEAGAPVRQQTIWEIENRDPPRRISVGEAIAFMHVFGLSSITDLVSPVYATVADELAAVVRDFQQWQRAQHRQAGELRKLLERYERLRQRPEVQELAQAEHETAMTRPVADMRLVLGRIGDQLEEIQASIKAAQAAENQ